MKDLSEFDKGRIMGALAFWNVMAQNHQIPVPSVDSVLDLPKGTTSKYLDERGEQE